MEISNIDFIPDNARVLTGEHSKRRRFILNRISEMAEEEDFREVVFPSEEMVELGEKGLRMEGNSACRPLAQSVFGDTMDMKLWYISPCKSTIRYNISKELTMFGLEILFPSTDPKESFCALAESVISQFTLDYKISKNTDPLFGYHLDGMDIRSPKCEEPLAIGARYPEGYLLQFLVDRIMLAED